MLGVPPPPPVSPKLVTEVTFIDKNKRRNRGNHNYTLQCHNAYHTTCFGFDQKPSLGVIKTQKRALTYEQQDVKCSFRKSIFIISHGGCWLKPKDAAWYTSNHCKAQLSLAAHCKVQLSLAGPSPLLCPRISQWDATRKDWVHRVWNYQYRSWYRVLPKHPAASWATANTDKHILDGRYTGL
jgi:hypothetical protein